MSTVRVTYQKPDGNIQVMMFGDSYKTWEEQRYEFENYYEDHKKWKRIKTEISKSKWKSWGGLKWCREENFQEELNREGKQIDDPTDNPNARQYSSFVFSAL